MAQAEAEAAQAEAEVEAAKVVSCGTAHLWGPVCPALLQFLLSHLAGMRAPPRSRLRLGPLPGSQVVHGALPYII